MPAVGRPSGARPPAALPRVARDGGAARWRQSLLSDARPPAPDSLTEEVMTRRSAGSLLLALATSAWLAACGPADKADAAQSTKAEAKATKAEIERNGKLPSASYTHHAM